jgi:chromosome segregation protein
LHSRRHDAELRLRGAETNLERLEDVVGELESQIESLKRQARQANRFKALVARYPRGGSDAAASALDARQAAGRRGAVDFGYGHALVGERAQLQMEAAKTQAIAQQASCRNCARRKPPPPPRCSASC